jgi:RNA-binding protein YhbY
MKDPNKMFVWAGNGFPTPPNELNNSVSQQLAEAAQQRELLRVEMVEQERITAERNAALRKPTK